jgi:hypothetical protein
MQYRNVLAFATLAEVATAFQFKTGQLAFVDGNLAVGDGGAGFLSYDEASSATADGVNVIAPVKDGITLTKGRWLRHTGVFAKGGAFTLAQPTSGSIAVEHKGLGGGMVQSTFTLTAARVPVTDAAGSGSHGSLKLLTLPQGGLRTFGCRQNYTAFAEGSALTGGAGDAVFDIGVGSVAKAAAADGALGGANDDDIGGEIAVTLVGGTAAATLVDGLSATNDGTTTPSSFNLNVSGTAATIDATSYIDVTGTITILWSMLGDD